MVFTITPLTYADPIKNCVHELFVLPIVLTDTSENIFNRMVFGDEYNVVYSDDEYKNAHKDYCLKQIRNDLLWSQDIADRLEIEDLFYVDSDPPKVAVERLIEEFDLLYSYVSQNQVLLKN